MTYDPGMCDTFTTMPPPYPGRAWLASDWRFYMGDQDITDELADHLADDAILAGILRKAVNGGSTSGVVLAPTGGDSWHLSTGSLRITADERAALRRAAGQPLP